MLSDAIILIIAIFSLAILAYVSIYYFIPIIEENFGEYLGSLGYVYPFVKNLLLWSFFGFPIFLIIIFFMKRFRREKEEILYFLPEYEPEEPPMAPPKYYRR